MLMGVQSELLPKYWHMLAPLIDRAVQSTECDYDIDDVYKRALTKECQVWAWIEENEVCACFVTEIIIRPKRKILTVPLIGGRGLKAWRNGVDETLGAYGKSHGCEYMEGYARKGWLRVLSNWFTVSTTIRRKL
jgi:hypothetical protein